MLSKYLRKRKAQRRQLASLGNHRLVISRASSPRPPLLQAFARSLFSEGLSLGLAVAALAINLI
jgi:CelD/BcsL family acetyltransferase involved in cellulose biosynthesis